MKNFVKNLSDGGLAEDTHAFMERVLEGADKTREEERLGAAFEFYDKHKSAAANVILVNSFVYGSKWTDANPQFSKEKFIEKACDWLVMNASDYAISTTGDDDDCVVSLDMVEDFRKAMEE